MKIVADENIPCLDYYFRNGHELILKPGRQIHQQDVVDADILLVRSVTPVTKALLQDSSVKFVGSTTTGFDHLDLDYLKANHIEWEVAKGCNATAVVEYVLSVIAALQQQERLAFSGKRAGVIGAGRIGSEVIHKLKILGFEVLACDPLRAQVDPNFISTPLAEIMDVDFISLHTPLTCSGQYSTFHMIDKDFLRRQKKGCCLLNTGRGPVVNFSDLKQFGTHLYWCLDVWETEPHIDIDVLKKAMIATPHIAGYSIQSKFRGIDIIYQSLLKRKLISPSLASPKYPTKTILLPDTAKNWRDVYLAIFNPLEKTQEMKEAILNGRMTFDNLRQKSADRFECAFVNFENLVFNKKEMERFQKLAKPF